MERYAFELLASYQFENESGGGEQHSTIPEIAYGFARNAQLGIALPLSAVDDGSGTEWGLGGIRVFGLYNFNTESRTLPAVSLRADAALPIGLLAGERTRIALKAIATRSWGRMRAHLNASRGFGPDGALSRVEPLARWSASLAVDRTFFRSSFLLVGELATTQLIDDAPSEVTAAVGGRWQWTPTLVLDLGVVRRLSDSGPDLGLTLGLSHAFASPMLMPGASP